MKYAGYLVLVVLFILASCSQVQPVPEPILALTPSPQPSSTFTATSTATNIPSVTPTPQIYTLRVEFSTTSDWSELKLINFNSIQGVKLVEQTGTASATTARLNLNQSLESAEADGQVSLVVDYYVNENSLDDPIRFQLQKGAINRTVIRFYTLRDGEEMLLEEVVRQGYVPTDTDLNRYEFSFDPMALKEAAAHSETATPVPLSLVFEEDFESDVLGWDSVSYNPYRDLKFSYGSDGINFQVKTGGYYWKRRSGNLIKIDGDFELEAVLDHSVNLSGLWFSNGTVTQHSSDNWFFVMLEQDRIGTYQPSSEYWGYADFGSNTLPGEIGDYITGENGEIQLHLSFHGDQLSVSVNGSPPVKINNELYAGTKYFMGFVINYPDQFTVKALRVWVPDKENFQIVNMAEEAWAEAVPTIDTLLTMTPIPTNTPSQVPSTPIPTFTVDQFVGTWLLISHRYYGVEWEKGDARASYKITKDENKFFIQDLDQYNRQNFPDKGKFPASFEDNSLVIFKDHEHKIEKLIFTLEGRFLHVVSFNHFTDTSGRPDYIYEYLYRKQ